MIGFKPQGVGYGTYYSSPPTNSKAKVGRLLIIGVIVAVLLMGGMFALTLSGNNAKADLVLLGVHENSLLQVANNAKKSIKNADLTEVNSNATILLQSDIVSIVTVTGSKKLPEDKVKQSTDTESNDKLTQAGLLNKFDLTFRQIMLDKVSNLTAEARRIRNNTSSKKTREALDQILTNLDSITKQFTKIEVQ